MSETPGEVNAARADPPSQQGGHARPADPEGATNGFTAVNGRGSPASPTSGPVAVSHGAEREVVASREQVSELPIHTNARPPHPEAHGTGYPMSNTPAKRKRSVDDVEEEEEDDDDASSDGSAGSPRASPDVHMHNASYSRTNGDMSDHAWQNQNSNDDDVRMLAPIQHENQQHANSSYPSGQSQPSNGLRPGYSKDEETGLITTNAGVQMDPKKRKRAFTNRTKTGCTTCRRRKKKCDEAKPECNNCTRGGFRCEGYNPKVSWTPESRMKGNKQATTAPHGAPRDGHDFSNNIQPRPMPRHDMPPYVDLSPLPQSMRPRPSTVEDGYPSSPYASAPPRQDAHNLPVSQFGMRDAWDRPMSSLSAGHPYSAPMHGSSGPHSGMQGLAQRALQHPVNPMAPIGSAGEGIEKMRMKTGQLYLPFDSELDQERQICQKAVYTFNDNNHRDRSDRMRSFRDVVSTDGSPSVRLGNNFEVCVPFQCEYGYNIRLGEDVVVESGCHISDPRLVRIDNGTYIGRNVTISGKVLPFDPNVRGSAAKHGRAKGFEIHIGKNVHIGAGSIIQPEESLVTDGKLVIGDGAHIKPMSLVSKNIAPNVIYGPRIDPNTGDICTVISPQIMPYSEDQNKRRTR